MAIERGVDDLDKADLDIQDNTKEVTVDIEPRIDEMFDNIEDDQN